MFVLLPSEIWRLRKSIDAERRRRLLSTSFEKMVEQIKMHARLVSYELVHSYKRPDYQRAEIGIELPAALVDLFHSGAGGYRAQFYESPAAGERANHHAINALQELFVLNERIASQSIGHASAKVWIREGAWCDDQLEQDRNLQVERWRDFATKNPPHPDFASICMSLTPERETHLEIKGAWIHKTTGEVLNLKRYRSQTLHEWGFT